MSAAIQKAFVTATRAALELGAIGDRGLTSNEADRFIDEYGAQVFLFVLNQQTALYCEHADAAEEAAAAITHAMRGAQ